LSDFVEVSIKSELKDGILNKVVVKGRELLVVSAGGNIYCADARCPHLSGDLSKGTLQGTVLTCPVHHSRFDLKDGSVVQWTDWSGLAASVSKIFKSPRALKTYPVKVDGDKVLASID
jgi:3-phenylpropionate/trans-cinnamate dioxygenase ferredoxin component